jgi:hypothetical protein
MTVVFQTNFNYKKSGTEGDENQILSFILNMYVKMLRGDNKLLKEYLKKAT